MIKLALGVLVLLSCTAQAEVYRWTDANGKVHYGDKKSTATAENITEKVKKTNVDTSSAEHQKLEALFRKENDADREYQQEQAQPNLELLQRCAEAKDYLEKISGRVQFIDDNGQPVHITETERQERAKQWQAIVKENCPN
jgi:hypothetical protein